MYIAQIFTSTIIIRIIKSFLKNFSILSYSPLSQRQLREVGKKYGSSVALCHIQKNENSGGYTVNVANTGLTEIILCKGTEVMPLAKAHNPETDQDEIARVVSRGGYISEVPNR